MFYFRKSMAFMVFGIQVKNFALVKCLDVKPYPLSVVGTRVVQLLSDSIPTSIFYKILHI